MSSSNKVPILMYHSISDSKNSLSLSVDKFYNQMNFMKKKGYNTVNLNEINQNDKNKFIITFDDGYEDVLINALPILKKFDFKATCFFVTDYLNLHNIWDQHKSDFILLKTMSKIQAHEWLKNGMTIGSHTSSHKNLQKININEKISQISRSKNFFKEEFNIDVKFFSYPYGSYDNETVKIIKKYYEFAVTTKRSRYIKDKFNEYLLPRVPVNKNDSLVKFFLKIKTPYEDIKYKND